MRKLLLDLLRLYFRKFPIRKGKIPLMNLVTKTGLTKGVEVKSLFSDNLLINLNLDDWIQKQIFFFGRYEVEKEENNLWNQLIKEGDYVLDIGANIGYYTLQASRKVGEKGKVFCFEPVSKTYNYLIDNIKLNHFSNIVAEKLAISDKEGVIEIYTADEKNTGTSSITKHSNFSGFKEEVKTISMDDYLKNHSIKKIDIIKIDVEGAESRVIKGISNTLKSFKPVVLIEVIEERLRSAGSSTKELYELFFSLEFKAYELVKGRLYRVSEPKEAGLILFKHTSTILPANIALS